MGERIISTTHKLFSSLVEEVSECYSCEEMAYVHVLGSVCGPLDAHLLIVGEAPGRLGSAKTGIPFRGDRSSYRLDALLELSGIDRSEVFVTDAVLCNPLRCFGDHVRNRTPRARELAACDSFFRRTLDLVQAPIVVALGAIALRALNQIERHDIDRVSIEAGRPRPWAGRTLIPLVHPSPRTQGLRSWAEQRLDWASVGELVRQQPLEFKVNNSKDLLR